MMEKIIGSWKKENLGCFLKKYIKSVQKILDFFKLFFLETATARSQF